MNKNILSSLLDKKLFPPTDDSHISEVDHFDQTYVTFSFFDQQGWSGNVR